MLGRYETQIYVIPIAGMTVRVLGPRYPHALNDDPAVRQRAEADGYQPHWAQPWVAAVMLAEHVIQHGVSKQEPILELGAGLGIAGVALAMAGYRMIVTDYDEDALRFVRASAELNGAELQAARCLDWRQPPAESFETIVGADLLWEKGNHAPLAALLAACLRAAGQAFLSDPNRSATEAFPGALQAAGLTYEKHAARARAIPAFDAIDGRVLNGAVYRIGRPRPAPTN
jgi:predicted nicotinamide N-methyase